MADGVVAELAAQARAAGRLGIDTEFMGEGRYRALLCLIQIAVADRRRRARRGPRPADRGVRSRAARARCWPIPTIQIVLHAGRQDVALLRREWSTELHGHLRHAGRRRLRRPARPARLRGAAARDARRAPRKSATLHALGHAAAERRAGRLRPRGRPAPARSSPTRSRTRCASAAGWTGRCEECRSLEDASDEREPETIFDRLPRVNSLDPSQRAVAYELVRWREDTARETTARSRACWPTRRWSRWPSAGRRRSSAWRQIRGLNESTLRRRGRAILEAVERGRERDAIPVDGDRPTPTDAKDAPLIALGEALVRARASRGRARLRAAGGARRPAADRHGGPHLRRGARRAHAAGLAARGRRRRAARAAAGPPLAARRARTDDRGHLLKQRYPSGHAPSAPGPAHLRIDAHRRRLRRREERQERRRPRRAGGDQHGQRRLGGGGDERQGRRPPARRSR